MGKLRFTLTYILFWFVIIFSCLLAENFALLSSDHMGGMRGDSLAMLSMFLIFVLVFYYFLEGKKNGMKFDKILLPIIATFGLVCIATVWWQGVRIFDNEWKFIRTSVSFSFEQKFTYSLEILVWCAVLYGTLFVFNRYSIFKKLYKWLPFVYIIGILACSFIDIIIEFNDIVLILSNSSEYTKDGMQFIIYNSNVWALLLLIGLLSCLVMNLKKFNLFYYLAMIHLFLMIVLTSSTTSTFVGFGVIFIYTLYEIIIKIRSERKKGLILLAIFLGSIAFTVGILAILAALNVPFANSFVSFIEKKILFKDYSTVSLRRSIWSSIYHLLTSHPIDFIFGCGYKTSTVIFANYFEIIQSGFNVRSAHNGLFEIFLRHGLLGLIIYAAAFVPFVLGVIKLVKKKQYRVAFIYSLCVIGAIGHSMSESTTFFTPNIEGMYLTIVFFLPVANVTKEKYFIELERDAALAKQEQETVNKEKVHYFIQTILMGSIIAVATTLLLNFHMDNIAALIAYLVILGVLLISLFALPVITMIKDKKPLKEALGALVILPIKRHYLALLAELLVGVLGAILLPLIFKYDLFSYLLFTLFVFVFYNFALQLMDEKNNYLLFSFFNDRFTALAKNSDYEVQHE